MDSVAWGDVVRALRRSIATPSAASVAVTPWQRWNITVARVLLPHKPEIPELHPPRSHWERDRMMSRARRHSGAEGTKPTVMVLVDEPEGCRTPQVGLRRRHTLDGVLSVVLDDDVDVAVHL
jgi:hypothetical protein